MLSDPLFLLVLASGFITLGVLTLGLVSFARGGDFHKRNSNRIMRWRVGMQFVTVVLFMIWIYVSSGA